MEHPFYAFLSRMRYITRWGLMRNTFSENIAEHSHQVAVLAHSLALIRRDIDKMNDELPNYKHILRLTVTDQEMAKTTTGKVKRYVEVKPGSMI